MIPNINEAKKKILIADDSEMNRELLTEILGEKLTIMSMPTTARPRSHSFPTTSILIFYF